MSIVNEAVAKKISSYDLIDLIKYNAACFLLPENANKIMRLELMANYILSNAYVDNKPQISNSNLRNMYRSQFKEVQWAEDPPEQMYSNTILFHGGNYKILPGINENGAYILQNLLKGIYSSNKLSNAYKNEILSFGLFVLKISDLLCEKASITQLMTAKNLDEDIVLPLNEKELILKGAVSFDKSFIHDLMVHLNLDSKEFARYIVKFGEVSLEKFSNDNHPLQLKMFVDCNEEYIVFNPTNLLGFLRHYIICKAVEYNEQEILASCFTDSVWNDTKKSFNYMDYKQLSLAESGESKLPHLREMMYEIDNDKLAYVVLLTDNFSDYAFDEPYTVAGIDFVLINNHIKMMRNHYENELDKYAEVFTIVVLQQCGRSIGAALEGYVGNHGVQLSAEDLKIFAGLEEGNSLSLYYFSKLVKRYKVEAMNFLDSYSYFINNKKTFYQSDTIERPTLMLFPGECRQVVEKYYMDHNPHGAPTPTYNNYMMVENFNREREIPIFSAALTEGFYNGLYVEREQVGAWIITNSSENEEFRYVDTVAYWFWQFEEVLDLIFERNHVTINITLTKGSDKKYVELRRSNKSRNFDLIINRNIDEMIATDSNIGERLIMSEIINYFNDYFECNLEGQLIQNYIEQIMPIGPKKKLMLFNSEINDVTLIEPGKYPTMRYIEPIIIENLLDEVGKHLLDSEKYTIDDNYGSDLLNDSVGYLFKRFEGILQGLGNPEEALIDCMLRYEDVIRKREENKFTMVTSIHCYPSSDRVKMIQEREQDLNQLSISLRFIIEYLGTMNLKNDVGKLRYSLSVFDELIAIVSKIIQTANYSDLIQYNLTNLKTTLLKSNRIGFSNRHTFEDASMSYLSQSIVETLNTSSNYFNKYWVKQEIHSERSNHFKEKFEQPFKDEFGVSYNSYIEFMNALIDISYKYGKDVCAFAKASILKEVSESTGMALTEIEKLVNLLVMPNRTSFLKVNKPYTNNDVVPWKFNRKLSYLRKPILSFNNKLIWSRKHLYTVMHYLFSLCLGGRLRAKSQSMKELISFYQNQDGDRFNEAVYSLFEGKGLIIDKQVKKFGNKKIASVEGNDLGDIDVLVINPDKKIILLLECKDLSIARNVYEISHELTDLYQGADNKRSIVERHYRRFDWVKSNLSSLLDKYKLNHIKGKWHIKPIVIISQAMVTPHLIKGRNRVGVMPLIELEDLISDGRIFRK